MPFDGTIRGDAVALLQRARDRIQEHGLAKRALHRNDRYCAIGALILDTGNSPQVRGHRRIRQCHKSPSGGRTARKPRSRCLAPESSF